MPQAAAAKTPQTAPVKTAQPAAAKKPEPTPTKAVPVAASHNLPAVAKKPEPVAAKKPATPATKAVPVVVKPAAVKEEQSAARVTAVPKPVGNKRDPFVSPIVRASGATGPVCETGKRCLMVEQIQLKGIVKSVNGYIAVVENAAKRAYFLRENDPVFNGSVVKITGDTVVFREQTVDKLGKQGSREVTKKVNAPVV
jgi:Tfp pilus assembly protein PilP